MNQKPPFFKTERGLLILGFVVITLVGIPLTVYYLQQQQIVEQEAWHTTQSATAACGQDGTVIITVQFKNTEASGAANAMNVVASHSSGSVNLGTVNPGETKSGDINTNLTSLPAGAVGFALTWANGRSGADTRSATFPAVSSCAVATPTPTNTSTPTPTIPVEEPTPTPTDEPTVTPTSTTEVTPTETVTPTEEPTTTPTTPPEATSTTAPQPTIAPSGTGNLLAGFGIISVALTIIGGLIFILL